MSLMSFLQAASGEDQSMSVLVKMASLSFFFSGLDKAMIQ